MITIDICDDIKNTLAFVMSVYALRVLFVENTLEAVRSLNPNCKLANILSEIEPCVNIQV